MFVYCECCLLSGTDFCNELITRPEESYRLWCVVACDLETSRIRWPWATGGGEGEAVFRKKRKVGNNLNPLNTELNLIYHLLTLLGAHPIFRISRIRVN
jgi:hypothetical protein